jgi:hypothetical protein
MSEPNSSYRRMVKEHPMITSQLKKFDAANILVVNDRQLLYLTSISGNFHGLVHLKEYMKKNHDMEVVPMTGVYSGLHIDSTICILNRIG